MSDLSLKIYMSILTHVTTRQSSARFEPVNRSIVPARIKNGQFDIFHLVLACVAAVGVGDRSGGGGWRLLGRWGLETVGEVGVGDRWGGGGWRPLGRWGLETVGEVGVGDRWGGGGWRPLGRWGLETVGEVGVGDRSGGGGWRP